MLNSFTSLQVLAVTSAAPDGQRSEPWKPNKTTNTDALPFNPPMLEGGCFPAELLRANITGGLERVYP